MLKNIIVEDAARTSKELAENGLMKIVIDFTVKVTFSGGPDFESLLSMMHSVSEANGDLDMATNAVIGMMKRGLIIGLEENPPVAFDLYRQFLVTATKAILSKMAEKELLQYLENNKDVDIRIVGGSGHAISADQLKNILKEKHPSEDCENCDKKDECEESPDVFKAFSDLKNKVGGSGILGNN